METGSCCEGVLYAPTSWTWIVGWALGVRSKVESTRASESVLWVFSTRAKSPRACVKLVWCLLPYFLASRIFFGVLAGVFKGVFLAAATGVFAFGAGLKFKSRSRDSSKLISSDGGQSSITGIMGSRKLAWMTHEKSHLWTTVVFYAEIKICQTASDKVRDFHWRDAYIERA